MDTDMGCVQSQGLHPLKASYVTAMCRRLIFFFFRYFLHVMANLNERVQFTAAVLLDFGHLRRPVLKIILIRNQTSF